MLAFPDYLGDFVIGFLGFLLVLLLVVYFFLTPYLNYRRKGEMIDREMHLFITRMGVLSASEASRKEMFEVLAGMREYGELAHEIDKIFTLVTRWNVSLEKACRTVATQTPSEIFSNFLLRLAHAVETGETAEEFFEKEQTVIMDQYEIRYNSSMRSVEFIKELFIVLSVLVLMVLIVISFLPFFDQESNAPFIVVAGGFLVVLDVIIMYLLESVVPGERIWHDMKMRTEVHTRIKSKFQKAIVGSLVLTGIMVILWPFVDIVLQSSVRAMLALPAGAEVPHSTYFVVPLIVLSIGLSPLIVPAVYVASQESEIKKRDAQYPAFLRSLGGAVGARSKSITLPLKKLRQHDFGPLKANVDNLYKRLSVRIKNERAWEYFASETLSELISKFNEMYVEGARTGDTKKISKIISDNFIRINGLREMKYESGSTFLWMLYGLTMAMSFLMFFGLYVVEQFANLFKDPLFANTDFPTELGSLFFFNPTLANIDLLWTVIWVVLAIHCAIAAVMVKSITGGHRMAASLHFVGMLWCGTLTGIFVMYAAQLLVL